MWERLARPFAGRRLQVRKRGKGYGKCQISWEALAPSDAEPKFVRTVIGSKILYVCCRR